MRPVQAGAVPVGKELAMKVVNPDTLRVFDDDHPTGALRQRYLLQGEDGSPENFMFSIADNVKRFQMVRHRHNFDQFRFTLSGDMSMGPHRTLREGCLGYFPEGSSYGPQDDPAGPTALVLQFGGASGYGYMSMEQYRAGRETLNKTGRFEGPVYIRPLPDGRTKKTFSINAIWEESLGAKLLIPAPRYDQPVFIDPRAFRWVPTKGAPGVFRKHLGTFSEREVMAEEWLVKEGAHLDLGTGSARRLLLVLDGRGTVGDEPLGRHFGIQIDPGEHARVVAREDLTLLSFYLPPVGVEWTRPELESFEPVPGEAVAEAAE